MIKKLFLISLLIFTVMPVFADDINMTPQGTFSGFNNNEAHRKYPQLTRSSYPTDTTQQRNELMKPKSVREMGNINPSTNGPMTYSQFPQNYDSSNMMLMQNVKDGMQNMLMGY